MKFSLVSLLAYALAVEGHAIFQVCLPPGRYSSVRKKANLDWQKLSVNGQDQGQLTGLRTPNNNNPVQDVNSQNMVCGQPGHKSQTVINVKSGDRIGSYWGHVVGGAQFPGDPDNPIAKSHKGPVMAYLAKVDNAASASLNGLKWYVAQGVLHPLNTSL